MRKALKLRTRCLFTSCRRRIVAGLCLGSLASNGDCTDAHCEVTGKLSSVPDMLLIQGVIDVADKKRLAVLVLLLVILWHLDLDSKPLVLGDVATLPLEDSIGFLDILEMDGLAVSRAVDIKFEVGRVKVVDVDRNRVSHRQTCAFPGERVDACSNLNKVSPMKESTNQVAYVRIRVSALVAVLGAVDEVILVFDTPAMSILADHGGLGSNVNLGGQSVVGLDQMSDRAGRAEQIPWIGRVIDFVAGDVVFEEKVTVVHVLVESRVEASHEFDKVGFLGAGQELPVLLIVSVCNLCESRRYTSGPSHVKLTL